MLDGSELVAGSMGDLGCFSFFPSKNMAVGGEGGMLTTTVDELTDAVSLVVNHGRSPSLESMQDDIMLHRAINKMSLRDTLNIDKFYQ